MESTENVLEIRDLVKDFPGVRAVDNVSFDIKRNTVHCLVGENGAGKSTLIKILTGAYTRTSGTTLLNGEEYDPHNPKDARLWIYPILPYELEGLEPYPLTEMAQFLPMSVLPVEE